MGQLAWRLYASARYLERAAPLRSAGDLAGHALVGFDTALSRMPQLRVLEEWGVGRVVFRSNAAMAVAGAVAAHQGVAALTSPAWVRRGRSRGRPAASSPLYTSRMLARAGKGLFR
ncbi:MAG TPA: hypothetical protein VEZ71_26690 [Archangium sp.]|nr:hypothetical protein [Archangium sp.]